VVTAVAGVQPAKDQILYVFLWVWFVLVFALRIIQGGHWQLAGCFLAAAALWYALQHIACFSTP
jgi:hypothetical protein